MHDNAAVSEPARRRWLTAVLITALIAFAVWVWGGYAKGWAWTGLSSNVTLWDWLEGLALPVTVGLVPLLLRHRDHLGTTHKAAAMFVLVVFVALVLAGYLMPMTWTGFTGNTLWDWLSLALLPLVIATSALWRAPPEWSARHTSIVSAGLALAVLLMLAGYLIPWSWTGFTGNTAWDWFKLLLLPLLLPTLVMPRLLHAAEAWMATEESPPIPSRETPSTGESAPADH
jgi:hypothetical protein